MSVHQFVFEAIGTQWVIDCNDIPDSISPIALEATILHRISEFDMSYSRFRDDSLVATISRQAGEFTLPADAQPMFDLYETLYKLTNGLFTPLIGRTLEEAGYDKTYSLQPRQITAVPRWHEVMQYHFPLLTTTSPVVLDFGAAGKGYLIDIISSLLTTYGIGDYTIDAGGDMIYCNQAGTPLRVGLEDPNNSDQVIGVATILNQALAGSAPNRRRWRDLHHIFNPHSLRPTTGVAAVWVSAATAMIADALTTCLFLNPSLDLTTHFAYEYVILFENRMSKQSPGFPGEIFVT